MVPFRGDRRTLLSLCARVGRLRLGPDDSAVVVDNTPGGTSAEASADRRVKVLPARERQTPGFARNRGAELGRAPWLVFFDADTDPSPDLLDCYFEPAPSARTGLLAGGVVDQEVSVHGPLAARYTYLRRAMSQDDTFRFGFWSFPKSANLACRREAFEAVGGFREHIRGGEDADLTYRMRACGWQVERRDDARVVHLSRPTTAGFVAQKAVHGAGMAWLNEAYPGSWPARRRPGLLWWGLRRCGRGLLRAARRRDRDLLAWAIFEPLELLAFEFGRSLPNERPLGRQRARGMLVLSRRRPGRP